MALTCERNCVNVTAGPQYKRALVHQDKDQVLRVDCVGKCKVGIYVIPVENY